MALSRGAGIGQQRCHCAARYRGRANRHGPDCVRGGSPSKPIRLIVIGTLGQGTDVLSRLVAQRLLERIKQKIIVENKAGAHGFTSLMAANAAMHAKLPFDPLKDLAPVPVIVPAAPDLQVSNVRELIAAARARSGSINVAIPSTSARVMLQMFNQVTEVEFFPVNYKETVARPSSICSAATYS